MVGIYTVAWGLHSDQVISSKQADTLICHTTMRRNAINFLSIPGHMTLWCLEVVPVAYAIDVIPWQNTVS